MFYENDEMWHAKVRDENKFNIAFFLSLNTKISDSLKNKVYVLSSTKRGRLLIQISPKNVIYILRSLISFVNDKVQTLVYSKTSH